VLAGLLLSEHDDLRGVPGCCSIAGAREAAAGRLVDTVQETPIGQLAVENLPYEFRQAIEDLTQQGRVLAHPDPGRIHVDADDRFRKAHERAGYRFQAGPAEQELG
jgi:hypothetical protein